MQKKTLVVSKSDNEKITRFLHATKDTGFQGDNNITYTVSFGNGIEMDVSCCGSPDGPSWAEAVLFANGNEVCYSPAEDSFTGEWKLRYNGEEYLVVVDVAKEEDNMSNPGIQDVNGIALTISALGGKVKTLTLAELMQMAGFERNDKLCGVRFSTEKDGYKLVADASLDPNYPGFNIDGYNGDKLFWLANAETPNKSWPHDFVARLYAGAFDYETDAPIAMVKSNSEGVKTNGLPYSPEENLTKNVFVDCDIAAMQVWKENGDMAEHKED